MAIMTTPTNVNVAAADGVHVHMCIPYALTCVVAGARGCALAIVYLDEVVGVQVGQLAHIAQDGHALGVLVAVDEQLGDGAKLQLARLFQLPVLGKANPAILKRDFAELQCGADGTGAAGKVKVDESQLGESHVAALGVTVRL